METPLEYMFKAWQRLIWETALWHKVRGPTRAVRRVLADLDVQQPKWETIFIDGRSTGKNFKVFYLIDEAKRYHLVDGERLKSSAALEELARQFSNDVRGSWKSFEWGRSVKCTSERDLR